jgi:toxin ParE1/3/4
MSTPLTHTGRHLTVKLTDSAQRDINQILQWTQQQFGLQAAQNYLLLIQTALKDLSSHPARLGVRSCPEVLKPAFIYHLRYSKQRMPAASRIKQPRHMLVFSTYRNELRIARILHDSMDIQSQVISELGA